LLNQLRATHQHLDSSRVVVGLITNSDNRTADILTSLGVRVSPVHYGNNKNQTNASPTAFQNSQAQYDIDFTVLSYDVGAEKPDRRIFTAAEEMLASLLAAENQEVESSEWSKVYVGDEYAKDVVGATQAGWKAILIDREADGQREDVEWLHGDQPGSVFDVLARVKAVGFRSLGQLAEWLPRSG
jgi:hypothetical protein